jgi:hypothetical protein
MRSFSGKLATFHPPQSLWVSYAFPEKTSQFLFLTNDFTVSSTPRVNQLKSFSENSGFSINFKLKPPHIRMAHFFLTHPTKALKDGGAAQT